MFAKPDRVFLARWVRAPFRLGAVAPSGRALARLMARQVDPARPGPVIELGGGTGAITAALLEAGVPTERLVVFERDGRLFHWLTSRFPQLRVLRADATRLADTLREQGLGPPAAIVSSLPLLAMSERLRWVILDQAFGQLGPGAPFVQYTYGPHCPLSRPLLARHGMSAKAVGTVWRNLPPATVWRTVKTPPML